MIILTISAVLIYQSEKSYIENILGKRVNNIAKTTSLNISQFDHELLKMSYLAQDENIAQTPYFIKQQKILQEIKNQNGLQKDIYTFFVPSWDPDKIIYLATSDSNHYIGNSVKLTSMAKDAVQSGRPLFSKLYENKSGKWISAVAPLLGLSGEVIGAVAVDYNASSEILRIQKQLFYILLLPAIISIILSIIFSLLFSRLISQPIKQLAVQTQNVIDGDLSIAIAPTLANDEISMLGHNFVRMIQHFKIKELETSQYTNTLEALVDASTAKLKSKNIELKNNINELENTQKQIIRYERMASIGQMAAGLGHEVNNTLLILKGHINTSSLHLTTEKNLNPDYFNKIFHIFRESVDRISFIVGNLCRFSRDEKSVDQPLNLHEVILETIAFVDPMFAMEGVTFTTQLEAYNDNIFACRHELEQILINLFNNAKHATEKNKTRCIAIDTKVREDNIYLTVEDNGHGMDQKTAQSIFDPFFTTKPAGVGTGLGLGVCRSIIQRINGDIHAESTIGIGTKFIIRLPIHHHTIYSKMIHKLTPKIESEETKGLVSGASVLLVDDNDDVRHTIALLMEEFEVNIDQCACPEKAISLCKEKQFDFIFTDYHMPIMNGVEMTQQMRHHIGNNSTIILVTGNIDVEPYLSIKADALPDQQLFDGVLRKPFDPEDLVLIFSKKSVHKHCE